MVSEDGVTSRYFDTTDTAGELHLRARVLRSSRLARIYGRWVQKSREEMGRQLARESRVDADLVVPVPDSGVTAAIGYCC